MISIVIPSYNSERTIRRCLGALIGQDFSGDYEIILVDSSHDRTAEIVSGEFPGVQMIHLPAKTDPGTARNLGIGVARGEIIAFIDSDCIAAGSWLGKIFQAHQSSQVRVIGGAVKNGNAKEDLIAWAGYMAEFREFLPEQSKRYLRHIPTCNISYRKSIFTEFGLFQGRYYPQEDLVFNYNLWKSGERILLDPSIQVSHLHRSSLRAFLIHQDRIGEITSRVLKKFPLQGYRIARNPVAGFFFLPLLPAVKFIKTVKAFSRFRPGIPRKPKVLMLLALGMAFWARGFAREVYRTRF